MAQRGRWPEHPVIYQIYPRSFQDTTGSGEGDLKGVLRRLDHIKELGADAIWLSPFFVSPMCDGGYDVADMTDVDPRFGTMSDFDDIVARAHDLGLLVMIDQVFNHTSIEHPWFQRSRDGDEEFRDFYVWADAREDGSPPSNWIAFFGHPSWRWHPQRGQYCLHQFLPCQPCLNHHNPAVHERLRNITRFWRDRGVDGFRYDAVTSFYYDRSLSDNPPSREERGLIAGPPQNPFTYQRHEFDMLPKDCAAFSEGVREWVGEDMFMLGEINKGLRSVEIARDFTQPGRFDAGYTVDLAERGVSGTVVADVLERMDGETGMAWWLSSHDQPRHVSRAGDGTPRDARLLAAMLLAMPGTILLFQGEELGMPQADLTKDQLRDPFDRWYWPDHPGRDGARGPIAWDDGDGMGFTSGTPWMPLFRPPEGPASEQRRSDTSVYAFYRKALDTRKRLGLADAAIEVVEASDEHFSLRLETTNDGVVGVAVNLSASVRDLGDWKGCERLLESCRANGRDTVAPRSALWVAL